MDAVEEIQERTERLVRERQQLRSMDAVHRRLEANRLDLDWLREGKLARILALLDCDGEEARVVGGAVRNILIGEPTGEIDLATTALPDEVMRRARAAGF